MFGMHGRTWAALGDPIGPADEWAELVWRFIELADAHGGRVAFYQIPPASLPLYLDAGLKVMKLGEEARIPLAALHARRRRAQQSAVCAEAGRARWSCVRDDRARRCSRHHRRTRGHLERVARKTRGRQGEAVSRSPPFGGTLSWLSRWRCCASTGGRSPLPR